MDMLETMRNGLPSKVKTSKKQSKVLVSPGNSMSMEELKEREKKQKENEKSKKANSAQKATSKTITCENESSEDETDESDIESMKSTLMVRKFDFILYKIWGKESRFSFGFNRLDHIKSRASKLNLLEKVPFPLERCGITKPFFLFFMLICINVNGFFNLFTAFHGIGSWVCV